jgi:membrane-bound metal-dependent hydrolase YbcI (DUF457 family)
MLIGHYAVGLIAKRAEPRTNLGTLVLAAMFADFAWCVFMFFGLEHVQLKSGMGAGNYLYATNIAMSHSLLMDAVWATLLASAYLLWRHYPRGALVIFLVVLSHWLLGFVSHRPDMPIAPGMHTYVGLGLWKSIPATLLVEGGFWCLAIILYVRATRSKVSVRPNHVGSYGRFAAQAVGVRSGSRWMDMLASPGRTAAR